MKHRSITATAMHCSEQYRPGLANVLLQAVTKFVRGRGETGTGGID